MTRHEAAKKICPIMPPSDNGVVTCLAKCCSTGCMMWREVTPAFEGDFNIYEDGYCGLAGVKFHI